VKNMRCPKCSSTDVKIINYLGAKVKVCNKCGYDERDVLEQYPEDRTSQKAKGRYNMYKSRV